jgi:transcriptional regulator with XRE-family HTH domain
LVRPSLDKAYDVLRAELVAARKRAGLSQREIAAVLGGHQQLWSKIESGERRIDLVELVAVAPLLALDVNTIMKSIRAETVKPTSGDTAPLKPIPRSRSAKR